MFNIVLVEPEIPQNTGNIIRTAAATGCKVHLVRPLGFDISDKALKRAGLDYWHLTDFTVYDSLQDFFDKTGLSPITVAEEDRLKKTEKTNTESAKTNALSEDSAKACLEIRNGAVSGSETITITNARSAWYLSTKAAQCYDEAAYREGDYLVFGKETKGLPEQLLKDNYPHTVRIPMISEARSLNLSNAVAITVYEGMRQNGFENLNKQGKLTT